MEKNNDGSIRSRCMDCEYSGKIPKDSDRVNFRNKGSKKTECPWHINLSQLEMCHAHYAVHYVMRIMRIMRIMQNPCNLYNTPVINKNHNISISINPTDIKHISSESSR